MRQQPGDQRPRVQPPAGRERRVRLRTSPPGRDLPAEVPRVVARSALPRPDRAGLAAPVAGQWFDAHDIRPRVVGEFDDAALLQTFAAAGHGLFAAPTVIAAEIARRFEVRPVGEIPTLRERCYAISVERRLKHPAVVAICAQARGDLFEGQVARSR